MNIDKLCKIYNLGNVQRISQLTGGLMHKMYKVETDKNTYAIKVLNPEVIKRKNAYDNFIKSEEISNLANQNNIPVSNALLIDNKYILNLENEYYMVFDFVTGKTLTDTEITTKHCQKIGTILAKIHNLNYKSLGLKENITKSADYYEWSSYLTNTNFDKMSYKDLYLANYQKLYSLLKRANERFNESNKNQTICHRDMDPKNVMWHNNEPIILDWEAADLANPEQELLEVALNWSGFLTNNFNSEKFLSVIKSYFSLRKPTNIDWYCIICGNLIGRLGWLDYNLNRSLSIITTNQEEITIAQNEVSKTINEINRYLELIGPMEELITSLDKKDDASLIANLIKFNPILANQEYHLINAGFTNKIYEVGDKYIIRICVDFKNEERFLNEIKFYKENKSNPYIPKMYHYDTSKKVIPYYYEIIEKIKGQTIYEIWYKLTPQKRENLIAKIVEVIKTIHQIPSIKIDYKKSLKEKLSNLINKCHLNNSFVESLLSKIDIYFAEEHLRTLHTDIHFDNLILDENNNIKIIDFERISTGPLDYDFKIFYICETKPWLWASSKTDMLTFESDYQNFLESFKKYYPELNNIEHLEQRLSIYKLLDLLKDYLNNQDKEVLKEINFIIDNLK